MKKWFLIICMCIACSSLNAAQQRFVVNLVPIATCSDNLERFYNRHKLPKKQIFVVLEGNVLYVQNAPVGGQVSFYDAQGNLLAQEIFPASECAIDMPALASYIEISYSDVTLRGDLEESN